MERMNLGKLIKYVEQKFEASDYKNACGNDWNQYVAKLNGVAEFILGQKNNEFYLKAMGTATDWPFEFKDFKKQQSEFQPELKALYESVNTQYEKYQKGLKKHNIETLRSVLGYDSDC